MKKDIQLKNATFSDLGPCDLRTKRGSWAVVRNEGDLEAYKRDHLDFLQREVKPLSLWLRARRFTVDGLDNSVSEWVEVTTCPTNK